MVLQPNKVENSRRFNAQKITQRMKGARTNKWHDDRGREKNIFQFQVIGQCFISFATFNDIDLRKEITEYLNSLISAMFDFIQMLEIIDFIFFRAGDISSYNLVLLS